MNGAEFLAYPPVVASGNNANTIHYINNTQMVGEADLILMDAGNVSSSLFKKNKYVCLFIYIINIYIYIYI